jgi:hypothetical protein
MGTPLLIDDNIRAQIKSLAELAEANPVDVYGLLKRLRDPAVKKAHMAQMSRQSIDIPFLYRVTYSIELNHPCGKCRHMSMSVQREGRIPNEIGLWMVAKEFGFWGKSLRDCAGVWTEHLQGHGQACNLVQPYTREQKP